MAKITTNTQIDTINILNEATSANNSDLILLQRGLVSYKIQKQNLRFDDAKIDVSSGNLTSTDVNDALEELFNRVTTVTNSLSSAVDSAISDAATRILLIEERYVGGGGPTGGGFSGSDRTGWLLRYVTKFKDSNDSLDETSNIADGYKFTIPEGLYSVESMCSHTHGGDSRPIHRLWSIDAANVAKDIDNNRAHSGPGNVFGSDGDGNTSHGSFIINVPSGGVQLVLEQSGHRAISSSNSDDILAYTKWQKIGPYNSSLYDVNGDLA